jgi:hypothetical protein
MRLLSYFINIELNLFFPLLNDQIFIPLNPLSILIILKLIWRKSSFFASNPKACLTGRQGWNEDFFDSHPLGRGKNRGNLFKMHNG